jgi:flagellar protein FlgJ
MAVRMDPPLTAAMTGEKPAQSVNAHDFKQFAALRRDANDPATLREVARQFESIFTKMMLDSMRSASFGDPLFGSDQADMYQDMMDDQMAVQLTSGRGIGLADMLIRQLSQGGQGAQAAFGAVSGVGSGASTSATSSAGSNRPAGLPIDDAQRREFVERMLPHARTAALQLGVDERSVIAQAALETGWGTSRPGGASGQGPGDNDSHNYFGIKASRGWHGERVFSDTTEYANGVAGTERAQFRAYGSVAENMEDYVRLLSGNPRYAGALNTGTDVRAFATALQRGGYATDPRYADKLVSVAAEIASLNVKSFKSAPESPIQAARTVEGNG